MRVPSYTRTASSHAACDWPVYCRNKQRRSCAVCCKEGSCSFTISTCRVEPCMRNLGLISSLVSINHLPESMTTLDFPLFYRMAYQHFDQYRLQRFFFAQDAPETLEIFALTCASTKHNRHLRFRDIDSFIEHFGGHNHTVVSALESVENVLALSNVGFMRNHGYKILPRNRIGHRIGFGKHQDAFSRVL